MAVLSVLSRVPGVFSNISRSFTARSVLLNGLQKGAVSQLIARRMVSGAQIERAMDITSSRFQHKKLKDLLHFYTLLGVIPLSLFVLYVNIMIGNAELAEIPEGYVPKHWEYFKYPISRWFARYFQTSPQERYEVTLHTINEESEQVEWRLISKKVHKLMRERNDYRGYYHIPSNMGVYMRKAREEADDIEKRFGYR